PHYINTVTERQAQGFIFSDNLTFGLRKQLPSRKNNYELNIQYRFRHISNAGLSYPNKGINNGFLILGITKVKRLKSHIEG
ncbi:MAG TPA: acyloxyacyl hydrolase, partial [Saprospiraceae bacterium]|nr:acyloxyacyl hydrolase [Saprospiraceae bacterium]